MGRVFRVRVERRAYPASAERGRAREDDGRRTQPRRRRTGERVGNWRRQLPASRQRRERKALAVRPRLVSSQRRTAGLSIDRAAIAGLSQADRRLVRAFLQGLNETASRAFDRSGLQTLAAREGDRLSIQTELGTKDAHVQVHVGPGEATVLYTDCHRPRSRFFRDLMRPHIVEWETSRPSAALEKNVGKYMAPRQEELEDFVRCLASRLVYLVDWNRARKRLSRIVKNADAIELLKWAADN